MKDRLTGRLSFMSQTVQKKSLASQRGSRKTNRYINRQILNAICKANNLVLSCLPGQTEVLALVLYAVDDNLVFECASDYLDYVFERLFVNQF